jgi:hypothetical protein
VKAPFAGLGEELKEWCAVRGEYPLLDSKCAWKIHLFIWFWFGYHVFFPLKCLETGDDGISRFHSEKGVFCLSKDFPSCVGGLFSVQFQKDQRARFFEETLHAREREDFPPLDVNFYNIWGWVSLLKNEMVE